MEKVEFIMKRNRQRKSPSPSRLRTHATKNRRGRRAFLLVMVLIVVAMAGLAALNFSNSMVTSHETSVLSGAQLQARMCSESGVQAVRLFLSYDRLSRLGMGGQWDNAGQFQALNVIPNVDPKRRGNFTVISPSLDQSGSYSGLRYGLQNESTKINLNALAQTDSLISAGAGAAADMGQGMAAMGVGGASAGGGQSGAGQGGSSQGASALGATAQGATGQGASGQGAQGGQSPTGGSTQLASQLGSALGGNFAKNQLLGLPGMTEDIADAILDWLDEDEDPRPMGAEFSDYYMNLQPQYRPTNGPLQSIEQLLLVRGITPKHLFGYDENRNGVLDSDEQSKLSMGIEPGMAPGQIVATDPNVTPPPPLGWAPFFTLHSQEKNVTNEGLARVNVNSQDLQALHQQLLDAGLNELQASFIVAYRLAGQPSPTASNPLALLMSAGATGSESGQQPPPSPPPPPVSAIRRTSNVMLVAFQQRGGGGGGRGGFGPGGGQGGGGGRPGGGGGRRWRWQFWSWWTAHWRWWSWRRPRWPWRRRWGTTQWWFWRWRPRWRSWRPQVVALAVVAIVLGTVLVALVADRVARAVVRGEMAKVVDAAAVGRLGLCKCKWRLVKLVRVDRVEDSRALRSALDNKCLFVVRHDSTRQRATQSDTGFSRRNGRPQSKRPANNLHVTVYKLTGGYGVLHTRHHGQADHR